MAAIYEIRVQGYIDEVWSDWFAGLTMTHTEQGETILRGDLVDQAALHGVLLRVHVGADVDRGGTPNNR